jgi:hypothetical protein
LTIAPRNRYTGPLEADARCAERASLRHDRRKRRKITKREAVVHQLVNKSTTADLRATKMLFNMMKDAEQMAAAASPPEPPGLRPRLTQEVSTDTTQSPFLQNLTHTTGD